MIDKAGFRHGIGIILINHQKQVFLAKRVGMPAWQFPQGGMQAGETPSQTMYRELNEEIGLMPEDVAILATTKRWLSYRLPPRLRRHHAKPLCIGQKQKWFLLKAAHPDIVFNLNKNGHPEFDGWEWVSYWHPLKEVISFKRRVYRLALKEFAKFVLD